jgi:hypothetical protein
MNILTDQYFSKMGLKFVFSCPKICGTNGFYHSGDLLADYTDIGLISSISTMETFRRFIAVYNANSVAGKIYKPSIKREITH